MKQREIDSLINEIKRKLEKEQPPLQSGQEKTKQTLDRHRSLSG